MKTFLTLALAAVAWPASLSAQSARGGFYVIPSVAIGVRSDSNVFSMSSAAESDSVRLLSPSVQTGYRSALWQMAGGYACDSEQYRTHPQLNDSLARQQADFSIGRVGRSTTLAGVASYLATNTPQELNVQTGLTLERAPATRFSVAPSMGYLFNARTRGSIALQFARSAFTGAAATITGASSIESRDVTVGLDRQLSARHIGLVQYQEHRFVFGGAPGVAGTRSSHALLFGWTHELNRLTQTTIMAGPRMSGGGVGPELSVDWRRRLKSGDNVSVRFERTEGVSLGETGTIDIVRLAGSMTSHPAGWLALRLGPGVSRSGNGRSGLQATVYAADATATTTVTRWLAIETSYQGTWQRGDVSGFGSLSVARSVFAIQTVLAVPGSRVSRTGRGEPQ